MIRPAAISHVLTRLIYLESRRGRLYIEHRRHNTKVNDYTMMGGVSGSAFKIRTLGFARRTRAALMLGASRFDLRTKQHAAPLRFASEFRCHARQRKIFFAPNGFDAT